MKVFILFFIISSASFSQYYYSPSTRVGNVKPLIPQTRSSIPLYKPDFGLNNQNFGKAGYTKTYYNNGEFHYLGKGYMSYQEREKIRMINEKYLPRYRMLESQMKMNNLTIQSEMNNMNNRSKNNNSINSAVNDNLRIEMEMNMIKKMMELDYNRYFK